MPLFADVAEASAVVAEVFSWRPCSTLPLFWSGQSAVVADVSSLPAWRLPNIDVMTSSGTVVAPVCWPPVLLSL